jgi:hypothetical protein
MSTLHHLELAVIDMTERMQRELQFSSDAKKQIRDAFAILHDAVENVEKAVNHALEERMRALSQAIGSAKPSPETVDAEPARKPKLVKDATDA